MDVLNYDRAISVFTPGQLAGFQSYVQRLQESIEMMQQSLQKAVQEPKVVYNLSGATIQGSVIGGSIIPADEGGW